MAVKIGVVVGMSSNSHHSGRWNMCRVAECPERVPVRETSGSAANGAFRIGGEEGLDHVRRRSLQTFELFARHDVAHGDETVAVEQCRGPLDLVR